MFTHGELMVDFVNVFVDPAMMQQPMQKVVPSVFHDSAAETLSQNIGPEEGDQNRESPPSTVIQGGCSNRWATRWVKLPPERQMFDGRTDRCFAYLITCSSFKKVLDN